MHFICTVLLNLAQRNITHKLFLFPTWTPGFSSNVDRACKLSLLFLQQQPLKAGKSKDQPLFWEQRTEVEGQIVTLK